MNAEKSILALDLATRTGFCHSSGFFGTIDLSVRRDESGGMRLIRLRGKLEEMRSSLGVALVVFEGARHAGLKMQGALVVQSEMQGVVKLWCEEHGIDYRAYSPSEIKKHATGKGNAGKEEMLEAARARWPDRVFKWHDEADATFLLDLVQRDLELSGKGEDDGKETN